MSDSATTAPRTDAAEAVLRGGRPSRVMFTRLFGLGRPALPFEVRDVVWVGDRFEVTVAVRDEDRTLTVVVEGVRDDGSQKFLLRSDRMGVWYRDGDMPLPLEERLRQMAGRWGDAPVDRLVTYLLRDPELREIADDDGDGGDGADEAPADGEGDAFIRSQSPGVWDPDGAYADLLGAVHINAYPTEHIELTSEFVRVFHGDLECICLNPAHLPSVMAHVDYPWTDDLADAADPEAQARRETTLLTNLDENDVVMGALDKLRDLLDRTMASETKRTIILENTCLPATTSEDVQSVINEFASRCPVPFACENKATDETYIHTFDPILRDRRLAAEKDAPPPDPRAVNLVGFQEGAARDELTGMLAALGITVNVNVLPDLSTDIIDAWPRAAHAVYLRSLQWWDTLYEQLGVGSRLGQVFLDPPYGVERTRAWLLGVAAAVGVPEADAAAVWDERSAPRREAWDALRARAREHCVGIVLPEDDLRVLEDPVFTLGVPLLAVLEEMGFHVDVMVAVPEERAAAARERVEAHLAQPSRHRVRTFQGLAALRETLAASESEAVISNYTFDWRLTEAGKNRIALREFEMGLEGAVQTLRRFLRACRLPFFRTYRRFLRRTPMGRIEQAIGPR